MAAVGLVTVSDERSIIASSFPFFDLLVEKTRKIFRLLVDTCHLPLSAV
jgi:hypothetical protein